MKSKLSLVLLAVLLLVPAARANSIDYSTGTFSSGALLGSFQGAINVNIVGSLNTIDIITGTLVKTTAGCPPGSTCFDFSNGVSRFALGFVIGSREHFAEQSDGYQLNSANNQKDGGKQERAVLLNGHLTVETRPGTGVRLTAEMPLYGAAE